MTPFVKFCLKLLTHSPAALFAEWEELVARVECNHNAMLEYKRRVEVQRDIAADYFDRCTALKKQLKTLKGADPS